MTIDKRQLPAAPGQLPPFTPVPRGTSRHDGWTQDRQRRFIEALAVTGSVKAAAHRVNMTPEGAYLLRRHPQAASFRTAWEAALALGVQQLEDIALERALHGTEVPVYSYGKLVGSRIKHNDRLLMFMLKNRSPTRFNAQGQVTARQNTIGDPIKAAELSRLKQKWRKEWEAEAVRDRAIAANARSRDSESNLIENIARMHERWFTQLGPRARAAYRSFRETESAEDAALRQHRWAAESVDMVAEDLSAATDKWTAETLQDELTAAQTAARAQAQDAEQAKADYAEWFTDERRAKVWWVIDVVFGALSRPSAEAEAAELEEKA